MGVIKKIFMRRFTPQGIYETRYAGFFATVIQFIAVSALVGFALSFCVNKLDGVSTLRALFSEMSREGDFKWTEELSEGVVYREVRIVETEGGHEAIAFAPGASEVDLSAYKRSVEIHDGYSVIHLWGLQFKGDVDINVWEVLVNGRSTMSTLEQIIWRSEISMFNFASTAMYGVAVALNLAFTAMLALIALLVGKIANVHTTWRGAFSLQCHAASIPALLALAVGFIGAADISTVYIVFNFSTIMLSVAIFLILRSLKKND